MPRGLLFGLVRGGGCLIALVTLLVAAPRSVLAQGELANSIVVDSISVLGNERIPAETVVQVTNLRVGEVISSRDIQTAIRALWDTRQFRDVQVGARDLEDGRVLLVIQVDEWEIIDRLSFPGLTSIDQNDVLDTLGLNVGDPYDPQKFETLRAYIRQELADLGIPFVDFSEEIEAVEGRANEIFVTVRVSEGQRVTVAQMEFIGNENVSDGDLIGSMGTKPEGFFWFRTGRYETAAFGSDLAERIPEFYQARGFIDAAVVRDTLIVDPTTGKSRIEISVLEGPRYRVADFEIVGNRRFETEDLEGYFDLGSSGFLTNLGFGDEDENAALPPFNRTAFDAAIQEVQTLYADEGYIRASIQPVITRHDAETEGADPTVSLQWVINEGAPAYVREIHISGNDVTHDWVILDRIAMLPGDVFSQSRLLQSYQAIQALGYFEAPLPFPSIDQTADGQDVIITFNVVEQSTGALNFGTTVGGGTGLSGFIGYDEPNLFGQGKNGSVRWDFGRFQNNFTLTYTDPAIRRSRYGGSVSLFSARDRFFQFQTGERTRTGGSVRFTFPMPRAFRTQGFIGYGLSRTDYDLRSSSGDTSLFGIPPGTQSTVSAGITRSTLNSPLFPTSGSRQSINAEFNGGVLGGDGEFQKYSVEGSWWIPAGQFGEGISGAPSSNRLTFGLTLKSGAVFGDVSRFPFERFWMGGVQFGEQLRGYDETSITPLGYFPERSNAISDIDRLGNAFMTVTAEYALRLGSSISLSAFYDAGNVWAEPGDINPTKLFRGAGFGTQVVTPFGPMGIDYAYGFDRPTPGWQLHFRLGPGF